MILPKGYKLLECIESTGTQYIDTGFKPTGNTQISMVVSDLPATENATGFFGTQSSSADRFHLFVPGGASNYRLYYAGSAYNFDSSVSYSGKVSVSLDSSKAVIGSNELAHDEATFTCTTSLFLLAHNNAGTASYQASAKLYSCQIWDNGTLVRQYAPCINPDGEVGLYDTVEGKFYGNAGTGTFVAGDELLEVEYIESSGTQYIDTGFKHNQDTRIVMDVQVVSMSATNWVFGGRISKSSATMGVFYFFNNTNVWTADYNGNSQRYGFASSIGMTDRLSIDYNKNALTINGSSKTFTAATFQSTANLTLLAVNTAGTISDNASAKLYSCQIYDNGTLIRHYIPMVTGGGVAGLYDLVNNTFSTDAAGGNFFAGPRIVELPEGYTQVEYIESSGTQYIDTGFKPTNETRFMWALSNVTGHSYAAVLTSPRYGVYVIKDGGIDIAFGSTGYISDTVTGLTFPVTVSIENGKVIANGTEATFTEQSEFSNTYSLPLFGSNKAGTVTPYGNAYLHACRIYDAGVLVRDFIPCTDPSGNAGLYDLVNGVFYANAGTGTFTVGAVVDAESQIPDGDETTLSTPANFRTEYVTDSEVSLAWDEVEAATGYKLYRNLALISDQTETEYTDTGLAQFASYQYYVVAYNEEEQSAPATLLVNTALADLALALVTDRTQADVSRVKSLASRWMDGTITDEEKAEYLSFMMKGAYNFTDLNRVERAVEYINDTINSIQADVNAALREHNVASDAFWAVPFAQLILEVKKNWAIADLPTESDLARYLDNVVQTTDRIGIEKNLPDSAANGLTYDGANEIEKALLAEFNAGVSYRENMKQLVSNTAKAFVQCGEIYGGEF